MATEQSADVVVVGSGVCGAMVAHEAVRAGLSVLILEAGPRGERGDYWQRFMSLPADNRARGDMQSPFPQSPYAPFPMFGNDDYLILKGRDPDAFRQGYLRVVGGTTWHWSGLCWRHLPVDLRLKSTYGVGRDWPISYEDLEPYYVKAEAEMGVSGPSNAQEHSPPQRSAPYVMESIAYGTADRRFADVATRAGYKCVHIPQAKNSRPFDGRPACCGSNSCMPICPIGALYNGMVHVNKALAGGAKLIDQAVVYRIDTDAKNRVTAVHYYDRNKQSQRVTGRAFVIAANGIETPRLLLYAANSSNPRGIANSSDQVGRNMMDHPGLHMGCVTKEPMWTGHGPVQQSSIVDFRDGPFRSEYSANRIMMNNQSMATTAGVTALAMGLVGKRLDAEIRRRAACTLDFSIGFEILPEPENRLRLSAERKDALGIPHPEVTYDVGDYVRKGGDKVRPTLLHIASLLEATEVKITDKYNANNHVMGGAIMGSNPNDSVVDADCRTHDHDNLYIAGGATMPTASCINSTLSMVAVSLMMADRLKQAMMT
jgi:choline dehydrogenase-like flavoprotein